MKVLIIIQTNQHLHGTDNVEIQDQCCFYHKSSGSKQIHKTESSISGTVAILINKNIRVLILKSMEPGPPRVEIPEGEPLRGPSWEP